ncbi:MAG TPA: BrnT family toxin [Casimicrobiaceae bacterium]
MGFRSRTPKACLRIRSRITVEDPDAEGEQRFVTIGLGNAGDRLVVVWTERDAECRPISARRATRKERKQYEG